MTVATGAKKALYAARAIAGKIGLRPHTVEVGVGSWTGPHTGDGTETVTWTQITEAGGQPPKVRRLSDEDVALGGLSAGAIEIGPITPAFPGGGTASTTIQGAAVSRGGTLTFRITGPEHPSGAIYRAKSSDFTKALHYTFTCEPLTDA